VLSATPAAVARTGEPGTVSGYTNNGGGGDADLLGFDPANGHYSGLKPSDGLVDIFEYYSDPAGTTSGAADGYLKEHRIRRGQTADQFKQQTLTYKRLPDANSDDVRYVIGSSTMYRNPITTGSAGAITTTYDYVSANLHVSKMTEHLPSVTDGPAGAPDAIEQTSYDTYDRVTEVVDGDGHADQTLYDAAPAR